MQSEFQTKHYVIQVVILLIPRWVYCLIAAVGEEHE